MTRLPSGQYILACWNSTDNPETVKRSKLLFQCHKLIRALRAKLNGKQIIIPSRDSKETRKGVEICVMYQAGTGDTFPNITDTLNEASVDLSLDYKSFVEQAENLTRYFNDDEMQNLEELANPITQDLKEEDFEELEKTADTFTGFDLDASWTNAVSADKISQPMLMTRSTLARLRKAEKEQLRKELTGYMDSLNAMAKAPKTPWQTIVMVATGMIAVGGWITKLSGIWAAIGIGIEVIGFVATLIGVAATAVIIGALVAVFGAIVGGLYLVFKGAQNIFVAVNNTQSDVWPVDQFIESGVVTSGAGFLPSTKPDSTTVWAGWYIYDRKKGFYGSSFGLTFKRNGGNVTIGMDCPNSLLGGRNSVCLLEGDDKRAAEKQSRHTHNKDSVVEMSSGKTFARISSKYGNINWAYLIFDGE